MKLWTIMKEDQYNKFIEDGIYKANPEYAMFPEAYKWLVKEMVKKIGNPENISSPVWAWYKASKNYKPDLRRAMYEERGTVCLFIVK